MNQRTVFIALAVYLFLCSLQCSALSAMCPSTPSSPMDPVKCQQKMGPIQAVCFVINLSVCAALVYGLASSGRNA